MTSLSLAKSASRCLLAQFAILSLLAIPSFGAIKLNLDKEPKIPPATGQSFGVQGDHFVLDGKPFRIISGEMHYARIPRENWRDRLKMAKAMGLNAITTYVFWNLHEPAPGVYNFAGNNDIAEFIRMAQSEGLFVILRPGPYICTEWDFGGYPGWLLKDHSTVVRSSDPKFIAAANRWIHRLSLEIAPLQISRGGPIIMMQIENEYGSFGNDHNYMNQIRQMLVNNGFSSVQLYTSDGIDQMPNGSFSDLPAAVNFAPGVAKELFEKYVQMRPGQPHMAGEYWDGWFDHWGGKHKPHDMQEQFSELQWILQQGYSINLYMFHGGTSFGFTSGANAEHNGYQPDVTSYDYEAPLDESGKPTHKYMLFRNAIANVTGVMPPPVPRPPDTMVVPTFALTANRSLWNSLPDPIESAQPLSMEDVDQNFGYIVYRTTLKTPGDGDLVLDQLHSYARVYLNGAFIGVMDRRVGKTSLPLRVVQPDSRLDILVENSGRVNFSEAIRGERAGITKPVLWHGQVVEGWEIYPMPMKDLSQLEFGHEPCLGPCFYQGTFTVTKASDTFLDMHTVGKGAVWINGHNIGRFWDIGPQETLFVPGVWLKVGENQIVVFNMKSKGPFAIQGLDHSVLAGPVHETE